MKDTTKFVGLGVSKEKIAVGVADSGWQPAQYWGVIENPPEALRKLPVIKALQALRGVAEVRAVTLVGRGRRVLPLL